MKNIIDLHVHSSVSDGTYTPEQLVKYAKSKNLKALALTDHDTVDGINEALVAGKKYNIEIIPGIELSAKYKNKDIHILGLYINHKNKELLSTIKNLQNDRNERNHNMVLKLNTLGFKITFNEVNKLAKGDIITRAHFAKLLMIKGYIKSMSEAFDKFIGIDCPGYVKRQILLPENAIKLIIKSEGIPVLAHPLLYSLTKNELEQLIQELKEYGLKGLEALYSYFNKDEREYLVKLVNKYGLCITGGSDFHGNNRSEIDLGIGNGDLNIPYEILIKIKKVLPHFKFKS